MSAERPNILLVMTDQHRGDCLGRAGHPDLLTPNLDGLANSGAFFTCAYSECPICIPARHALLTGKRPQTTGVTGFDDKARIADEEHTLPNLLRKAGYQTASIGRSMHTYPSYKRYGFETVHHNQDNFYHEHPGLAPLSASGGAWHDWPHLHDHGLPVNGVPARPFHLEEHYHETNVSIRNAINFIDRRDKEAPFFLYVGTVAPHPPLLPPTCYYQRYDRDGLRPPAVGGWVDTDDCPLLAPPDKQPPTSAAEARFILQGNQLRSTLAGYYGLINHFDDQLQLLLARLQQEGLSRSTYVIFTSDHGEMLGDHHCFRKSMPYEGSAHIPLIISGPSIGPGTVVREPALLMDILPTCCDLAGIDTPRGIEGKSLVPLTQDGGVNRTYIHGTHSAVAKAHDGFHYITDGRFKYIWWVGNGHEQLFDLHEDPYECVDLGRHDAYTDKLGSMRDALIELIADAPQGFVRDGQLVAGVPYTL